MQCMTINKRTLFYSLYLTKIPVIDEYGNESGETEAIYSDPIELQANISGSRGETQSNLFGESLIYDKTILVDKGACLIDEYSRLWIDTLPLLDENGKLAVDADGKIITPHDYIVKKKGESLNTVLLAVSRVSVSG